MALLSSKYKIAGISRPQAEVAAVARTLQQAGLHENGACEFDARLEHALQELSTEVRLCGPAAPVCCGRRCCPTMTAHSSEPGLPCLDRHLLGAASS